VCVPTNSLWRLKRDVAGFERREGLLASAPLRGIDLFPVKLDLIHVEGYESGDLDAKLGSPHGRACQRCTQIWPGIANWLRVVGYGEG
jgi:hypothetical protein